MGFFDTIGDAFDAAKDATGEALGLYVDVAKASNDGGIYSVDHAAVASAKKRAARFSTEHPTAVSNTAKVGNALNAAYSYGVARPLSTVEQVTGLSPVSAGPVMAAQLLHDPAKLKEFMDSDTWKQAWAQSAKTSPGQAATANLARGATSLTGNPAAEQAFGIQGKNYAEIARMGDPGSKDYNPAFSMASGTLDATLAWYTDPLVLVGKGARAMRIARTELRATTADSAALSPTIPTEELTRRGQRIRNIKDRFIAETDDYSAHQLIEMDAFRKAPNGAALASLFAENAGNHELKNLIWSTASGNQEARAALAARRADIVSKIDRVTEDIDEMKSVYSLVDDNARIATINSPEVIAEAETELKANEHMLDMYNRALDSEGGVSTIPTISSLDKARAADAKHYTLRDGPLGMVVRVSRSNVDHVATGMVSYHDAEGGAIKIRDMSRRIRNVDPATREGWVTRWLNAPDDSSRKLAYDAFRHQAITHIGRDLGYTDEELQHIIQLNQEAGDAAFGVLKSRAYAASDEGGQRVDLIHLPDDTWAPSPLDTTQLANSDPVMPIDQLYRALKRAQPRVSALRHGAATTQDIADSVGDTLNDAWRFAVLARLGYGIRNITDNQIRMTAKLGGLQFASMHLESAGGWVSNKRAGIPLGQLRQHTQNELDKVEAEIAAHRKSSGAPEAGDDTVTMYRGVGDWDHIDPATGKPYAHGDEFLDAHQYERGGDFGTWWADEPGMAGHNGGNVGAIISAEFPRSAVKRSDNAGYRIIGHKGKVKSVRLSGKDYPVSDGRLIGAGRETTPGEKAGDLPHDLKDRRDQLQSALEAIPTAPHTGQGLDQVGPYTTERAFGVGDDEYQLNRQLSSSDGVLLNLALSEEHRLKQAMRGTGDFQTIAPVMQDGSPNLSWTPAYLRVVNQHFRKGEIRTRLLAGESEGSVARWLASPEGRETRRRLVHRGDTPERIVHANAVELNHVIPDGPLRELARERPLTAQDVEHAFRNPADRPAINAEAIRFAAGEQTSPAARAYGNVRDGWFKLMNTFPEDVWARHPFYRKLYDGRRNQMIAQADPRLEGVLDEDQLRTIERNARQWARREMKATLFDVSSKSTQARFFRFMSPFYAAWQDTLVKYGRLAVNNPAMIRHAQMIWTAPNKSGVVQVVDQNGNPVSADDSHFPTDNEFLQIGLPKFMSDYFSVGQARIPKSSINIVLQGDPWWLPGFGPVVQVPVNEIIKRKPEWADAVKFILPYGPVENSATLFAPGSVKNALATTGNDPRYARSMTMVALTEMQKIAEGKREMPKGGIHGAAFAKEIEDRNNRLWKLRVATSLIAPVSVQYESPYQFYVDEYHRLLEKDPQTADEKFWKTYGDEFYSFSTSLSKNNTGIQATVPAVKASRRLKDLIAEDPSLGWMVVGPDNRGDFSQAVYVNQHMTPVKPGSDTMYRGSQDPWTAIDGNQADLGWLKYTQMMDKLDVALAQKGLHSYQQKGAEQLAAIKAGFTADLKAQNPAWADAFDSRDDSHLRHTLAMMGRLTTDDRTKDRADVQAMAEYMAFRKQMSAVLAQRAAAGGDKTLTSQSNADLAFIWQGFTHDLTTRYVTFAPIFHRLLETDDLRSNP